MSMLGALQLQRYAQEAVTSKPSPWVPGVVEPPQGMHPPLHSSIDADTLTEEGARAPIDFTATTWLPPFDNRAMDGGTTSRPFHGTAPNEPRKR